MTRSCLFTVLFLLAIALLLPGVRGTFIFDDFANLQSLDAGYLGVTPGQFITESSSGPLGRPVAMASFWLQADCWPESPACFKLVNLGLHLLNGVLVYFLVSGLLRLAHHRKPFPIALFITALWLLHPVHASTVFYVIQRMNLLAATFTLLGLLAWLRARQTAHHHSHAFLLWGFAVFPAALLLAAFSKENGLLLVAYVAVIELCLPASPTVSRYRAWRALFLFAPVTLVVVGLSWQWQELVLNGYANRPFTFEERVLTQFRALVDYLQLIVSPSGSQTGLFKEGYTLSDGWYSPLSTLFSALLLAMLTILALVLRKRLPLLALGWLWFLAGHAMESTVFPVEIYFEHRNYLPSLGPLMFVAVAGARLLRNLESLPLKHIAQVAFIFYLAYFAALAHVEARIWGNPLRQAAVWATENPSSPRAQIHLANVLFALGKKEDAVLRFEQLAREHDDPLIAWMSWLEARCTYPDLRKPPLEQMRTAMETVPLTIRPTNTLAQIIHAKFNGECAGVTPSELRVLVVGLLNNTAYKSRRSQLHLLLAQVEALDHNFASALAIVTELYAKRPDAELAIQVSAWHLEMQKPQLAYQWLEKAREHMRDSRADDPILVRRLDYLERRIHHALSLQE